MLTLETPQETQGQTSAITINSSQNVTVPSIQNEATEAVTEIINGTVWVVKESETLFII